MIQLVREKGASAAADEMLPKLVGDSTRASEAGSCGPSAT